MTGSPPKTSANTITLPDGTVIAVNTTAKSFATGKTAIFCKEDRAGMSAEKRIELFSKAVQATGTKYDLTPLSLSDARKLDDCYNLSLLVSKTRDHHVHYDMHGVFTIVFPTVDSNGKIESSLSTRNPVNLYKSYKDVTVDEVACSNAWYATWTSEQFYQENLELTAKHLEYSMAGSLWKKCYETYKNYPDAQKGGPLLFIIMINLLVSHTDQATRHVGEMVKKLKITNFKGENVHRIVSLIRGANKLLEQFESVPEDFVETVLIVLQTSSVEEFNDTFKTFKQQLDIAKRLDMIEGNSLYKAPKVETLLRLGETTYTDLCKDDRWTGVKTRGSNSALISATETGNGKRDEPICWNCSEPGHHAPNCPKPENPSVIAANKQQFMSAKKKGGNRRPTPPQAPNSNASGKWHPPTDAEKNKRVIDRKPMYWLSRDYRWVPDKSAKVAAGTPSGTSSVPPVSSGASISGSTIATNGTGLDKSATIAAITNMQQSMDKAFKGFLNQMS